MLYVGEVGDLRADVQATTPGGFISRGVEQNVLTAALDLQSKSSDYCQH
jgi:hypothetical protein